MKRLAVIPVLVLVLMLGMKSVAPAQEQLQMNISMLKDVSSKGETYGIRFDISGDNLEKASRVFVDGPRGRRIWVNNTLNLNDIVLSAFNLGLDEFDFWFPEGDYKISFSPPVVGKMKTRMTHNFPPTPAVLYPLEGSVDVPTNPVLTWMPITGLISLRLQLKDDAGFILSLNLPINATSYGVPANLLKSNTRYEFSLEAKLTDLTGNNGLITTATISFTTLAQ